MMDRGPRGYCRFETDARGGATTLCSKRRKLEEKIASLIKSIRLAKKVVGGAEFWRDTRPGWTGWC